MAVSGGAIHIPLAWAFFRWGSNNNKKKREEEEAYFERQQENKKLEDSKKKSEKSRLHNIARNTGDFGKYNTYIERNEGVATKKRETTRTKVTSNAYETEPSDEYIRLEKEHQKRKIVEAYDKALKTGNFELYETLLERERIKQEAENNAKDNE